MRYLALAAAGVLAVVSGAPGLKTPAGISLQIVASIPHARQLAMLPDGDLIAGTSGTAVVILPGAQSASPGTPRTFATIDDAPVAGVAYSASQHAIYAAAQHGIYRIAYANGDLHARAQPVKIASVRTGPIAPHSDGDVHTTTSVALSGSRDATLYASVGSSCNACVEVDPTRGTIQQMTASGSKMAVRAKRIRNAIGVAIDPLNDHLWAGGAGQDRLPTGHPFEFLDDVSAHAGVPDYGWPVCEERHVAYTAGARCDGVAVPIVEFPAYSTLMAIAFYPSHRDGAQYLGAQYAGGIFVARHGSWHTPSGCSVVPEVDFVPMRAGLPAKPVDWSTPTTQWKPFVTGFQPGCEASTRIGRPAGLAVGTDGSLFISDDLSGKIYRARP